MRVLPHERLLTVTRLPRGGYHTKRSIMLAQQSTRRFSIALAFSLALGMAACYAWADEGHNHGDGHNHEHGVQPAGQHGGQVAKTKDLCLEVVYQPKETRIYLYDHAHNHLSARGINGEALMQIRGNENFAKVSNPRGN